jgi:hypothetical protein
LRISAINLNGYFVAASSRLRRPEYLIFRPVTAPVFHRRLTTSVHSLHQAGHVF